MSIIEIRGGPLTHKKLMRRNKDDLANTVMACTKELEKALVENGLERSAVTELLNRIYFG